MSHLKLQKLLCYAEAYHLAYFGKKLTNCEYEAWVHGPVCRAVFSEMKGKSLIYADMKWDGEGDPDKDVHESLISTQLELLHSILKNLSTWTDLELEDASHSEDPWIIARKGYAPAAKCNVIIDKKLMEAYYRAEIGLA